MLTLKFQSGRKVLRLYCQNQDSWDYKMDRIIDFS